MKYNSKCCMSSFSHNISITDEEKEKEVVKDKGEKRKNVPLWKPAGPNNNSNPTMVSFSLF